jgi:hypothetical protein
VLLQCERVGQRLKARGRDLLERTVCGEVVGEVAEEARGGEVEGKGEEDR